MEVNLAKAEAAIARGDYSQSLAILEKLAKNNPISEKDGAKIKMLMVTAWMGQGQEKKAIITCRLLTRCKDPDLKLRAKNLLSVLEAPSLERPSNWSIQIPSIGGTSLTKSSAVSVKRKKNIKSNIPLPPTGPTKGLQIGFATIAFSILLCLTLLLSGCVRITTEINISGPDQIALRWDIESSTNQLMPWQIELMDSLISSPNTLKSAINTEGKQTIISPVLNSKEADLLMKEAFRIATEKAGFSGSQSKLELKERNWIIGIQQELDLLIDLSEIPEIPGLDISIKVNPIPSKNGLTANPNGIKIEKKDFNWDLKTGEINHLLLHEWKWSPLGIGSIFVVILLVLSLTLQSLRLQLGYGFPELPP